MPAVRINRNLKSSMYYLTFTVQNWYYLFDRYERWNILAESIRYCQKNKNLNLLSFVFMLNHIHLIVQSPDTAEFVRDFKSYTSRRLKENISKTEPGVLKLFQENGMYNFWGKTNMPKIIESEDYFLQKQNYIHNNPVKKGYVMLPEHWYWSSANSYCSLRVNT